MKIDTLITLAALIEGGKLEPQDTANVPTLAGPWEVGKPYFIRTVTHHYTGRLEAVHPGELVLSECAWIADSGRFSDALKSGDMSEIEPFPDGVNVIIGRGAIVDAHVFNHKLPASQK